MIRHRKSIFSILFYSTVTEYWCKGGSFKTDVIFHFTKTYRRSSFYIPRYSQYQYFLYDTIIKHREKGKTFDQIAEWLDEQKNLLPLVVLILLSLKYLLIFLSLILVFFCTMILQKYQINFKENNLKNTKYIKIQ